MGQDKAFLLVDGEPLLARQLRLLREAGATEILLSGRHGVDYPQHQAKILYDCVPEAGPLGGLAAALAAASCPRVLVLAVDLPEMGTAMLAKIVAAAPPGLGCVPSDLSGFQPLAAVYPKAAARLAEESLEHGKRSVQEFVSAALKAGLLITLPLQPGEQRYFTNWNSPGDWSSHVPRSVR